LSLDFVRAAAYGPRVIPMLAKLYAKFSVAGLSIGTMLIVLCTTLTSTAANAQPAADDAPSAAPSTKIKKSKRKPAAAPEAPVMPPRPPLPAEGPGTDYGAQVRAMFRVAACGGDDAMAPKDDKGELRFKVKVVANHCKDMAGKYASYKKAWANEATAFIAKLRPADLPSTVVYPFGGGDLTSALVVFPTATEITTISLEAPGDVRVIDNIKPGQFGRDLQTISHDIGRLYKSAHSTTKSLQAASHSVLPGTLMFALTGLAVHDMEPVSLRYFDLDDQGDIRYLTESDLNARVAAFNEWEALGKKKKRDRHFWFEQDSPFDKVEITFRPRSEPNATPRVFRHMVVNLDDTHTSLDPRAILHLKKKGKVSSMTKAASFLLWYDEFSNIRNYLLENIVWMITDASGLPPSYAEKNGFVQTTYGKFEAPYFNKDIKNVKREFISMWKNQPQRALPFRFGYPDYNKNNHMMVTARKP
jgi:hypothetical protein